MRKKATLEQVQRPQVLANSHHVELRIRVSSAFFAALAVQARSEGSTAGELVRDALASLLPPDPPAGGSTPLHVTKNGRWSVLSAEERRRAARGERIFG